MKIFIEDSALFARQVAKELVNQLKTEEFLETGARRKERHSIEFLSTKDAALRLGVHVNTIRSWAKSNQIESVRYGNRILIKLKTTTDGLL